MLQGQMYVACENVAAVAKAVMRHRVAVNFSAQSEGITPDIVVQKVLDSIPAR
jgi:MoxR-like ATPase